MSTQEMTATKNRQELARSSEKDQYTLWQILGIWLVGSAPMWLLAWVIAPALIPYSPLIPGITYWLLMIAGMAWQFIVSLVILYHELGTLRWSIIRQRTWLQTPRDPKTHKPDAGLFWWLLPVLFFYGFVQMALAGYLDAPMTWLFPTLQPALYQDTSQLAAFDFQGQWWLLGIALLSCIFNYLLGEELLFRGVLLPRMEGVFGKFDWVANAVLFGLYHLHKPWSLPTNIISSLAITWPSRRFQSNWMGLIVHGVEAFLVLIPILAMILGRFPH